MVFCFGLAYLLHSIVTEDQYSLHGFIFVNTYHTYDHSWFSALAEDIKVPLRMSATDNFFLLLLLLLLCGWGGGGGWGAQVQPRSTMHPKFDPLGIQTHSNSRS